MSRVREIVVPILERDLSRAVRSPRDLGSAFIRSTFQLTIDSEKLSRVDQYDLVVKWAKKHA
jgi:hypothetical protein